MKDKIITTKKKDKIVRQLNDYSSMLSKSFGLCRDHCQPHDERLAAVLKQDVNMLPPTTSGLRKGHKPPKEGEEENGPPMRPVCHTTAAPNNILSAISAPIIRTMAEKAENRAIASTEEMIATIEIAKEKVGTNTRKIGIGSLDCKALYPSLSREWVKKIILQTMDETKVTIEIENWKELALYIALTHKQEEIDKPGLSNVIYKRKHEAGQRPGITTSRAFSLPPKN